MIDELTMPVMEFFKAEKINCTQCVKCKPQEGLKNGVKYGICGGSGNLVYLEPWDEKRAKGSGYIHNRISGCGMHVKGGKYDKYAKRDD